MPNVVLIIIVIAAIVAVGLVAFNHLDGGDDY